VTDAVPSGAPRIRDAGPADAAALTALAERTFRDAFAADNRPEDVDAYVAATYSVEHQASELADPARITLVAETESGGLAGFVQLRESGAPACVSGPAQIELQRFYVDRPWQGRGLAQALMDAALDAAVRRGARTIWLAVWEHNPRAIRFYSRCGFRDVGSQPFVLGSDRQTDRVMMRSLPEAGTPPLAGPPEAPQVGR
jgi:ribosomal protein S18 acetylase RimI-like enzyme